MDRTPSIFIIPCDENGGEGKRYSPDNEEALCGWFSGLIFLQVPVCLLPSHLWMGEEKGTMRSLYYPLPACHWLILYYQIWWSFWEGGEGWPGGRRKETGTDREGQWASSSSRRQPPQLPVFPAWLLLLTSLCSCVPSCLFLPAPCNLIFSFPGMCVQA